VEREGKSVVVLATRDRVVAVFGIADAVRKTSRNAFADLHALGVRSVMLSGDNQQTATAIAAQVGIDDARGGLLPEEKLTAIHEMITQFGEVGMAGDGVNDAPALAAANIGFAMGVAGSDTALETADVALMDDDLRKLPAFIRLSRRTAVILTENITLALGIKAVFLGLAISGGATLWMAILADMGASLLVVFNGLRLLKAKSPFSDGSEGVAPLPSAAPSTP
jgi:Cd2+/Zn2+-exporting ATPase